MHTQPMKDSDGTFGEGKCVATPCRKCKGASVKMEVWESSCGGYEDYKFTCGDCHHYWWVEGPDS